MHVFISLVEAMSVFLVVSYVFCWSPGVPPVRADPLRPRNRWVLFLFFTGVTIMGNYLGIPVRGGEAIANTRAVGSVLGGLLGGPLLGAAVGITAGIQRLTFGGVAAVSGMVATSVEGIAAGLVRFKFRDQPERLFTWQTAALVTLIGEIVHQGIVLLLTRPFHEAVEIVKVIGPPMILCNPVGAALFMVVIRTRQAVFDRIGAASSALALRIAERSVGLMTGGKRYREIAGEMAAIVREETGVGAVAITDTERVLAWVGLGADHHAAGDEIMSPWTRRALSTSDVQFLDGEHETFQCRRSDRCPLAAVVVVPLLVEDQVVGTVQLFEPRQRRFQITNRRLGEGIGALLSSQLLLARFQEQRNLLLVAELKLLQAQVDPHFLFNSLNTIIAVTRTDPARARDLLIHLSSFFRKNLKRKAEVSTLEEELAHVQSYLEIELARFPDRLSVEREIDPELLALRLPTFTLQPLVENAIKHGLSRTPNPGKARIRAFREAGAVRIDIEDDAGRYEERDGRQDGLGMQIVDRRIKNLLGPEYGITVHCEPQKLTRVSIRLPPDGVPAPDASAASAPAAPTTPTPESVAP